MFKNSRKFKMALVAALSATLLQCGEEDKYNSKVEFSVNPESPVAIPANITLNRGLDSEFTIQGPYIRITMTIQNKNVSSSDGNYWVVVVAWQGTAENLTTGEITDIFMDPTNFVADTADAYTHIVATNSTDTGDSNADFNPMFFGGLPLDDAAKLYRYRIELEPIGWLSDVSKCTACTTDAERAEFALESADRRLTGTVSIYTQ